MEINRQENMENNRVYIIKMSLLSAFINYAVDVD